MLGETAGERANAWARAREVFGGPSAAYQVTAYVGAAAAATAAEKKAAGKKAADAVDAILAPFDAAALPRATKLSLPASALHAHPKGPSQQKMDRRSPANLPRAFWNLQVPSGF